MKRVFYILIAAIIVSAATNIFLARELQITLSDQRQAATQQYGLTGIYHGTKPTLTTGTGTALEVDSAGRPILSTTTNFSITVQ